MKGKDYFLDYKITVRVLSSVKMDRATQKLSLLKHFIGFVGQWYVLPFLSLQKLHSPLGCFLSSEEFLMTIISSNVQNAAVVMMPVQVLELMYSPQYHQPCESPSRTQSNNNH